jgi:2-polyprenyl-3-methyl-5-hydroxy-6-metoxy-1,4-benzoquinol methylase
MLVVSDAYYGFERRELADFAYRHAAVRGRVLDVGCAAGRLGQLLLELGAAEVWGIEPAAQPAALAAEILARVIQAPYPTAEAAAGAPFDLVVFADSLEHLVDPWEGLAEARRLLAVDGALLLALPNVSHYTVLYGLLRGRWQYEDMGLLDRTHLRFFTPASARRVLTEAGFEIAAEAVVARKPMRRYLPLTMVLERLAPHLYVYQWYALARPA